MFEQVSRIQRHFEEIEHRLCEPSVMNDLERYRELMKERTKLEPIVLAFREWQAAEARVREAQAMLDDTDAELAALAAEELADSRRESDRVAERLRVLLLPQDPNDARNVIMEIRAGAGGEESALFAASLFRMYSMYAAAAGFTVEPAGCNPTELGGYREVSFVVTGQGAFSRLKYESGVHRVQRVPETESGGRIHTSTVTVAVLPEAEEVELTIDPKELQIDTYRSSGAGGQHINKTESAIRITHLPTGTVVECQDERSQYKNKEKAMRVLRARLYERKCAEQQSAIAADRRLQVGTGDRSERIRTYNFPQGRVTDHRIGLTLYKLDAVMNGDLTELIDALATAATTAQLEKDGETT